MGITGESNKIHHCAKIIGYNKMSTLNDNKTKYMLYQRRYYPFSLRRKYANSGLIVGFFLSQCIGITSQLFSQKYNYLKQKIK